MAKRKKKKLTAKQAEYRKQQKRLERYIREGRKFGYEAQFNIPSMPSRVTEKALREIKQIKPKELRAKGFKEIGSGQIYYSEDYRVRLNIKKGKFPIKKHKHGKNGRGQILASTLAYEKLYPIIKHILEILADFEEFLNNNYYHWSMWQISQAQWSISTLEEKLIDVLNNDNKLTELYISNQSKNMNNLIFIITQDSNYDRVMFAINSFLELLDVDMSSELTSILNEYNSFEEEVE